MSDHEQFFKWLEALIEEPLPRTMRDLLNISGFTSRLSILHSGPTWLQDIENFIRQNATSDFFRARLQHGQQLQQYTIPPGYKAMFVALKTRVHHNNYNCAVAANININTAAVANGQGQIQAQGQSQQPHSISIAEAEDLLESALLAWQKTHEIRGQVQYQVRCKQASGANGEAVMKLSATAECPTCERPIQLYMDESKRRWILSNLASHFQRQHQLRIGAVVKPEPDLLPDDT